MRIFAFVTIIAAAAIASAALPVEPVNAFILQQENNEQQVLQDKKPFDMSKHLNFISLSFCIVQQTRNKGSYLTTPVLSSSLSFAPPTVLHKPIHP